MHFPSHFYFLFLSISPFSISSAQISFPAQGLSIPKTANNNPPFPITIIHRFPPGTWVENLAIRPNGLILAITTTSPILYQLHPHSPPSSPPTPLHDFSSAGNAIQGITEIQPDVFALEIATCNLKTLHCTPGGYSVWELNLQTHPSVAKVRKVAALPAAVGLNGMATLNPDLELVVIADSLLGGLWRLDMRSGASALVMRDKSMAGTPAVATGINGVRVQDGYLWYTNSAQGTLNRVPIDPVTGRQAGAVLVLASGLAPDDFEVAPEGNWVFACNLTLDQPLDQVLAIGLGKKGGAEDALVVVKKVLGEFAGPTSVRKGRTGRDRKRGALYVSTIGGLQQYISGNLSIGGTVSRIDLEG